TDTENDQPTVELYQFRIVQPSCGHESQPTFHDAHHRLAIRSSDGRHQSVGRGANRALLRRHRQNKLEGRRSIGSSTTSEPRRNAGNSGRQICPSPTTPATAPGLVRSTSSGTLSAPENLRGAQRPH